MVYTLVLIDSFKDIVLITQVKHCFSCGQIVDNFTKKRTKKSNQVKGGKERGLLNRLQPIDTPTLTSKKMKYPLIHTPYYYCY